MTLAFTVCDQPVQDVMILADISSSISKEDLEKMVRFLSNTMARLQDATGSASRVGLTAYSDGVHPISPLSSRFTTDEVIDKLKAVTRFSGGTKTGSALQYVRKVFTAETGHDAGRTLIVVTDGQTADPELAEHEASMLRELDVTVLVVGIGDHVDRRELAAIASEPQNRSLVMIDNFDALSTITDRLTSACEESTVKLQNDEGNDRENWKITHRVCAQYISIMFKFLSL